MKKLKPLKQDYENIEIPTELEEVVQSAIRQAKQKHQPKKRRRAPQWVIGAAAAAALFVGSINVSPTFAQTMANVPFLGSIVEVITVQQIKVDQGTYQADLNTPALEGLNNPELQTALNEKYIAENKALYEQFEKDVADMEQWAGGGHLGVDSGYEVLTETDQLLSIARYEVNIVGSSSTVMKYDTVDKENGLLITLPSLFKDESYVAIISAYILYEMKDQMAKDDMKAYFLPDDEFIEGFEQIRPDQPFYITAQNKLVVSFDKYEVAPGYMGVVTFEIPTDVIKDVLVSDLYIK
ncbi:DUF3298 domain-containing protein [Sporosarcina sp. FSL W7-1349]|uniref:DUF3298 and DUF4163 domain-containing protein n=1 Tax=Sporosarcina sp. FSL W7-1349 TaxID=2921561 RepID=UPI0030F9CAA3